MSGERMSGERRGRVVIVGGGIAGLAAAFFLRDQVAEVLVLEASPRLGGKLASSQVAGVEVDAGAEALLARRPEAVDLIGAVGLAGELVYPGTTSAGIWSRGELCPLPGRQFMGVPSDFDELERSGILSREGLARARQDAVLPATARDGDVPVGEFVGARFGAELVDRLVEPLLGGVYAGRADQLSFEATLPALAGLSRRHRSLAAATGAALGPAASTRAGELSSAPSAPPMFTTLAGGLGALPEPLAKASGAIVRTGATVRALDRAEHGWLLTIGPVPAGVPAIGVRGVPGQQSAPRASTAPERVEADAVILALPARPASRLLAGVPGAGSAARALAEIEYASMAIVTLAYPQAAFGRPVTGSGYLVPAVDGRPVKAVTFSTVKWPHLLAGASGAGHPLHVVRCSVGRIGEEALLQRDDDDLAALAAADLAVATGVTGAPVEIRVTRWGGALPQYAVGHLDRVEAIRNGVAALPGLAVCGAAYDGVGIPACVASARLAADQVLGYLAGPPQVRAAGATGVLGTPGEPGVPARAGQ